MQNQQPSISPSASTSSPSTNLYDEIQTSGFVANLYPLFTSVFQNAKIPVIITQPFLILFFFQVLFISLWPWNDYWLIKNDNYTIRLLKGIFFFIPQPAEANSYIILGAILFAVNAIILILIAFQILYYKANRKFVNIINYPIRLYFDTILVATVASCLVNTGETFLLTCRGSKDPKIIVSMILFMLSLAFELLSFILVQKLASKSIFINISSLLNFDPEIMVLTIIAMITSIELYFLLNLFEKWAPLFAIFLHIAMYSYEEYYTIVNVPYVDITTNSLSFGWIFGCICGDIFNIVIYFTDKVDYKVPLIGIVVIFVAFVGVGMVLFRLITKKISSLMKVDLSNVDEANEYYRSLNLDLSLRKATLYVKIAFQNYCPCFYNWTLINFIAENYNDESILALCLQLASFFPLETRLQGRLQLLLLKKRKLKYDTGFLMYQIEAIKSIRQFSTSTSAKLKLADLKNMTSNCENMVKTAIDTKDLKIHFFEELYHKTSKVKVLWEENLLYQPNNPKFYEEYARFLIEAETSFKQGLKMKNKQKMLEAGANFAKDLCFRSMVQAFPKYLTEGIIDTKGKVVDQIRAREIDRKNANASLSSSQSQSNSGGNYDSMSSIDEVDDSIIEYLGKQTIKNSKVRLALDSMLETKVPFSIKVIIPITTLIALYCLVMFAVFDAYTSKLLSDHEETMLPLKTFAEARFYLALSNVNLIIEYAREYGNFDKYNNIMLTMFRSDDHYYIDMLINMLPPMIKYTQKSSESFSQLIDIVTNYALQGKNVQNFASSLYEESLQYAVCTPTGMPFRLNAASFQSIFAAYMANQREVSGYADVLNIMNDPSVCEITANFQNFYFGATSLYGNISEFQLERGEETRKTLNKLSISLPIITFIIIFVPVIIIHFAINRLFKNILEIFNTMDQADKNAAKEDIIVNSSDGLSFTENNHHSSNSIIILSVIGLMSVLCLLMCLISGLYIMSSNEELKKLNGWNMYSSLRSSLTAETMNILTSAIIIHDRPDNFKISSIQTLCQLSYFIAQKLVEADNHFIKGSEKTEACYGYDSILDSLNAIDGEIVANSTSPQDYFMNLSIHGMINVLYNYINSILKSILSGGTVDDALVANVIYLMNDRLFYKEEQSTNRILELGQKVLTDINIFYIAIYVCVVFFVAIYIWFVSMFYRNRLGTYRAALFVLKRFNPFTLINNKMFIKLFLKGNSSSHNRKMTIENTIIQNANDSIFCTSLMGMVEIVNNSVTSLLGYKPEQILGQKLDDFFSTKDAETLIQKFVMMKEGQISSFYEDDFTAISDITQEIPVHIIIIGMKKENENKINSFVVILRDQTALVKQKQQAEEAKAKSESLLYQILPRDIVVQLNRGETDISFLVPSATVIFIDINKFSEYTVNLSPQEIMANLSFYFAAIDKLCSKYNMITKIKLIGDIYMAASGLFNPDAQPITHAEQTIDFGLECINALDEVNTKIEAALAIRIGVNTGGPLIGGVLGTDKPVFDIIGDTINVAARLQTTSEVNHVHISQATYDLVNELSYEFEKRGETFLKGKGKQITYYVSKPEFALQENAN